MAVDAKLGGQVGFGWQPHARFQRAGGDVGLQPADDLTPERDPILAMNRMGCGVIHIGRERHRSFIQSGIGSWQLPVDDYRVGV